MKNKKLLYILFPVVIGIWGVIIYRVVSYTSEAPEKPNPMPQKPTENVSAQTDTFHLLVNYRDPFLKHSRPSNPKKNIQSKQKEEKKEPPQQKETNNKKKQIEKREILNKFNGIRYGGLIHNKGSGELVGLVTIKQREFLIRQGDTINKLHVECLTKDSVVLKYEKMTKAFYKK